MSNSSLLSELLAAPGPVPAAAWREAADLAGLAPADAAACIGVSARTWQRWERGDREGDWAYLKAFAAVAGLAERAQ